MTPKLEKNEKGIDLTQIIILNKQPKGSLRDNFILALTNSQASSFEQVKQIQNLMAKIEDSDRATFSTEEVVILKNACLQVLVTGAVIRIVNILAPNDLK